jgi:hypothetical protein
MLVGTITNEINTSIQYLWDAYNLCDNDADLVKCSSIIEDTIRKLNFLKKQLDKLNQTQELGQ